MKISVCRALSPFFFYSIKGGKKGDNQGSKKICQLSHMTWPFHLVCRKDGASDALSLGKWDVTDGRKAI